MNRPSEPGPDAPDGETIEGAPADLELQIAVYLTQSSIRGESERR